MIYSASGVLWWGIFCFESLTLYRPTHFWALKYSKHSYCWQSEWELVGIEIKISEKNEW